MLDLRKAAQIAQQYLDDSSQDLPAEYRPQLMPEKTQAHHFGWVFYFQSRKFIETGIRSAALRSGPLLIDHENGTVFEAGTAEPLQFYIDEFLRQKATN